jgi:hypothetical protein
MTRTNQLRERVRKVEALHRGAGTDGEREAAEAALRRLKAKLGETGRTDRQDGIGLSGGLPGGIPGPWPVHLFMSLCVIAMASGLAMMRASATRRP